MTYSITRHIEIDMGHRLPMHDSHCYNMHGHRYKIEATLSTEALNTEGIETGMVLDFGRLKRRMMDVIHGTFDHHFCMQKDDPLVPWHMFLMAQSEYLAVFARHPVLQYIIPTIDGAERGFGLILTREVPTAENLAAMWYHSLRPNFPQTLRSLTVWETPTCKATYTE